MSNDVMPSGDRSRPVRSSPSSHPDFPIVIIGAGFAGIGTAIALKNAGILSFVMLERASEVGGTWRDNTYPGCACDVPSHVYSFSFEPNPDWSRAFATSSEIQSYLLHCVEKHKLRQHMRFGTEVVGARFEAEQGIWSLVTRDGQQLTARFVVSCVGGLVDPAYPDIKGIEGFAGKIFHTARWDHDYELAGRRVAVIGTGASAVQVVPAIADEVEKLTVFQRTACWVMPKRDKIYSQAAKDFYRRHPRIFDLVRKAKFWLSEAMGPFVILDTRLSRLPEKASLAHLRASVRDPVLREKLTPRFQFGCKRVLISDDFWSTFEKPNVELVTEGIDRITAGAIETRDGQRHEVDAIILATGFALGLASAPFPVEGLRGRTLDEAWERGATAYKGMTVAGFPNWFILMGPNTGPGHTSVLVYTESQIQYTLQAIKKIIAEDIKYVNVKAGVQERYNRGIQKRMKYTAWSSGCNSWYLGEDGGNHSLFPGFASEYCARIRRFRPAEYEIVPF